MRAAFLTVVFLIGAMGAARADCLEDLGQLREQVDTQNQAKPTAQSQAAARELQKLERSESANEIDCINTLARARSVSQLMRSSRSGWSFSNDDIDVSHRHQQRPRGMDQIGAKSLMPPHPLGGVSFRPLAAQHLPALT